MVDAYLNRGVAYINLRENALALNDFSQALAIDSKNTNALFKRAEVYALGGQWDKALEDYDQLITLIPDYGLFYFNRSKIYKLKKDKQKAMEAALKARASGY